MLGFQTLRYRQSSLTVPWCIYSGVHGSRLPVTGCTHAGTVVRGSLTPAQWATGCGSRHRSDPVGAAANGMPSKLITSPCAMPEISPESILTLGRGAPQTLPAGQASARND